MYAIVDIAGQQVKVEKGQKIFVHRLEGDAGSKVNFDRVLLIDNNGKVSVGTPLLDGAKVSATILEHMKGDKVIVFKKKRRKGYKVTKGHRQYLTRIQIEKITAKASKKDEEIAEEKDEPKVEVTPRAKPEAKTETNPRTKTEPKTEPKEKKEPKAKTESATTKQAKADKKEKKSE